MLQHSLSLNFENIMFPVKLADIPNFEKQNEIYIYLQGFSKWEIFPIHISKHRDEQNINLFIISDSNKSHYCWIKDLDRLLGDQHTHHGRHFLLFVLLTWICHRKNIKQPSTILSEVRTIEHRIPPPTTEQNKWLHYKDIRKQPKVA